MAFDEMGTGNKVKCTKVIQSRSKLLGGNQINTLKKGISTIGHIKIPVARPRGIQRNRNRILILSSGNPRNKLRGITLVQNRI